MRPRHVYNRVSLVSDCSSFTLAPFRPCSLVHSYPPSLILSSTRTRGSMWESSMYLSWRFPPFLAFWLQPNHPLSKFGARALKSCCAHGGPSLIHLALHVLKRKSGLVRLMICWTPSPFAFCTTLRMQTFRSARCSQSHKTSLWMSNTRMRMGM